MTNRNKKKLRLQKKKRLRKVLRKVKKRLGVSGRLKIEEVLITKEDLL